MSRVLPLVCTGVEMPIFRIALALAALFLADAAQAYSASTVYGVQTGATTSGFTRTGYGSGAAACASITSVEGVRYWNGAPNASYSWSLTSSSGGACIGTGVQPPYPNNTAAQGGTWSSAGLGCPGGGTLAGSTCTCGSGYTDSGSACVANTCPAVGASIGTHAVTTGWALSSTPDAADVVVKVDPMAIYGASHCVTTGSGLCSGTADLDSAGGVVKDCWRATTASSQGLYRLSCDLAMKSTSAAACTADTSKPSDPGSTAASCPSGNVGTVNGTAVCLGTMPASGVNFGKPNTPGNPRSGSSPTDTNAVREPAAGSGGGADARGGPGVTVGGGGNVGTGSNRTAGGSGGGSSQTLQLPTDYQRDATGITANTKLQSIRDKLDSGLKVDETGTPTGAGAFASADTAAQTTENALKAVPDQVVAGKSSTSWGFSIGLPTGCTNPPAFVLPGVVTYTWDLCAWQTQIHMVMSFMWSFVTITGILGMVRRTIAGG